MIINFPTIGDYNQALLSDGNLAFSLLKSLDFIPSRTFPIKVFLFGSGAYAVVFKAKGTKMYAVRCFLTTDNENIRRYSLICDRLNEITAKWKVECLFLKDEIRVKGKCYPVLRMDWVEGDLLNVFITNNLRNKSVLGEIQKQLVCISEELELYDLGHGDLQCGNIMVQGNAGDFQLKLIDYDGMYISNFNKLQSLENGRSEFQHPKRTLRDFSSKIDRFSIWVMLTALEALKSNPDLWKEVMQGGYNTLDNMLFTGVDFQSVSTSRIFNELSRIDSEALRFYLSKLKLFSENDFDLIGKPILYNDENDTSYLKVIDNSIVKYDVPGGLLGSNEVLIESYPNNANVLTSMFSRLGNTPLVIDRDLYFGKTIIVSYAGIHKRILVNDSVVKVEF
ncbi:hypothetical protein [Myroides marinus]|uniref:hypothetical protein n=1 Tax=Myroides marinus TaxID=703342 RepID=UPI0025779201|nr:hypothetical protein [Myroides marinus]MDM1361131.1 hypothetical protein [Myroides marinus]